MAKAKKKTRRKQGRSGTWKRRGSHVERRAATRAKVLKACITALYELGFQATTTSLVAARAGVSRGALLQQFPTRLDTILSVAEEALQQQREATTKFVNSIPPGIERYKALADGLWESSRRPLRIALIELQLAARSDPQFAAALHERMHPVMRQEFENAWLLARAGGVKDRAAADAMAVLTLASLWGLAIMRFELWTEAELQRAFELLKDNNERLIERLLQNGHEPAVQIGKHA
jgi:AcrR family transcriptional regulator